MKAGSQLIMAMDQEAISAFEKSGSHALVIEDRTYDLTLDDVQVQSQDIPGWLVATDAEITVALDITIDQELRDEGLAREIVNRVQNMRKDLGFDVTERIDVLLSPNTELNNAVQIHGDFIKNEVLADTLEWEWFPDF